MIFCGTGSDTPNFGKIYECENVTNVFTWVLIADLTGGASDNDTLVGDVVGDISNNQVAYVGGSTAALVHSGEVLANAGTPFDVFNTLVKRDNLGDFAATEVNATLFTATGATASSEVLQSKVLGDAQQRFTMTADGTMSWGNGINGTDVNMFRSAVNTLTVDVGNLIINGYSKTGTLGAPTNTAIGDKSVTRFMVGTPDLAFSTSNGLFMITTGVDSTTTSGISLGLNLSSTWAPPSTAAGTYTGTQLGGIVGSDNSITGIINGASALAIMNGSGDIVHPTGLYAAAVMGSNRASNQGLLTITVNASGSGYTAGDVLTVTGCSGTGGTVTVLTVDGGGAVLTIQVQHPGKQYTITNGCATTGGTGTGAQINILVRGSTSIGTGNAAVGVRAQGFTAAGTFVTPTVVAATGIEVLDCDAGSGPATIQAQNGIDIKAQTQSASTNRGIIVRPFTAAATLNVGFDINAFTGTGTTNVGLRIATPSGATNNYALQFSTQSTTPSGGIQFGSGADAILANLYRSASGRLRTDGEFQALHYLCISGTPTIAAGTGAGTSPTISITGTDAGMQVSLTTGTTPAAAAIIFTVTYATAYSSTATFPVFSPAPTTTSTSNAAALSGATAPFIGATTTTTFTFRSGSSALTAATTYVWNFSVRA